MTISMGEIIARFKSCILGFLRAKTWDPVKNGPSQNTLCHPRFLVRPMAQSNPRQKRMRKSGEKSRDHINSGHLNKRRLCKGCLLSEGPRRAHCRVRDVDWATRVLQIDIAGPLNASYEGFHDFPVGALRLPDLPLLIDARLLKARTSVEVCAALEKMTACFESLSLEGFEIKDSMRIKRLHSDRVGEFTAPFFMRLLSNHCSIYHTLNSGYDLQTNGTAERAVGLIKTLASRCLNAHQSLNQFHKQSCDETDLSDYPPLTLPDHHLEKRAPLRSCPNGSPARSDSLRVKCFGYLFFSQVIRRGSFCW